MDAITFAELISYISAVAGRCMSADDIREVRRLSENVRSNAKNVRSNANIGAVDALLDHMSKGQKIEAIKRYRELTSQGLLESKNAIERYLITKPKEVA